MAEQETDPLEGEVVTDVSEGGEAGDTRRIRVYKASGDFIIEIPSDARLTFGYFNPASPRENRNWQGPGSETARTTCLRVYADNSDKVQLAAFMGINGFRDLRVGKVALNQSVTITHNFEDDGLGNTKLNEEARRALVAAAEDEEPIF